MLYQKEAYPERYLMVAMERLGQFFDAGVHKYHFTPVFLIDIFVAMRSDSFFRSSAITSGDQLIAELLICAGVHKYFPPPPKVLKYKKTKEYYAGRALAYYEWKKNISFDALLRAIDFDALCAYKNVSDHVQMFAFIDNVMKKEVSKS